MNDTWSDIWSLAPREIRRGLGCVRILGGAVAFAFALAPVRPPCARASDGDGGERIREDSPEKRLPPLSSSQWLESALVDHGFTILEAAAALEVRPEDVEREMKSHGLVATGKPRNVAGRIRVLPYPGGRHPRIGFLDGAIDPHRDTKASVFLPWEGAGYVVLDLPEALWTQLGLTYLAHTHIPTIWDAQKRTLERIEWTRHRDGRLTARRVLPNGIAFRAAVVPQEEHVDLELAVENGTQQRLTQLRAQVCVLLKNAPAFNQQASTNKMRDGRVIATRSDDGRRWIVTVWDRARPWDNPPCPCMHSDPSFPDLEPGEESVLRGRLFFWEGEDLRAELERRRATGTLEPQATKGTKTTPRSGAAAGDDSR